MMGTIYYLVLMTAGGMVAIPEPSLGECTNLVKNVDIRVPKTDVVYQAMCIPGLPPGASR